MVELFPLTDSEFPAVVELQNRLAPAHKRWTMEVARNTLLAAGYQHGKNVTLAKKNGMLVGVAAWVSGGEGEFFGAPLFAEEADVMQGLVGFLVERAQEKSSKWIRIMSGKHESLKVEVLKGHGFPKAFDFVEYELPPARFHETPEQARFRSVDPAEIDFKKYIALGNRSFANVDNSLPLSEEEAKEIWNPESCDHRLSRVWADEAGEYVAFAVVEKNGYVDSIGVKPELQGQGIAKALYRELIHDAIKWSVSRLHTVVSSNNVASLRLHDSLGFKEVGRRGVWELRFASKA